MVFIQFRTSSSIQAIKKLNMLSYIFIVVDGLFQFLVTWHERRFDIKFYAHFLRHYKIKLLIFC